MKETEYLYGWKDGNRFHWFIKIQLHAVRKKSYDGYFDYQIYKDGVKVNYSTGKVWYNFSGNEPDRDIILKQVLKDWQGQVSDIALEMMQWENHKEYTLEQRGKQYAEEQEIEKCKRNRVDSAMDNLHPLLVTLRKQLIESEEFQKNKLYPQTLSEVIKNSDYYRLLIVLETGSTFIDVNEELQKLGD